MDAVALGVLLDPPRAVAGELGRHLRQALAGLAFQAALGRRRLPFLALARPAALALGLSWCPGPAGGALARLNGGTVAGDVADQMVAVVRHDHRLQQPGPQARGRELGEGTAEGRLARHRARSAPAAKPPQGLVQAQALDQAERVVDVEDRLGEKGARRAPRDRHAAGRAGHAQGQEAFGARHLQHGDELAVAFTERPELFLQAGKQLGLDFSPIV